MKKHQLRWIITIAVIAVVAWAAAKLSGLYVDFLWFDSLGFSKVFTTELWTRVVLGVSVFLATVLWVGVNALVAARLAPGRYIQFKGLPWKIPSPSFKRFLWLVGSIAVVVVAYMAAAAATDYWYTVLQFHNFPSFGWTEPILGYDAGFYVFVLPVLAAIKTYAMTLIVLAAIGVGVAYFVGGAIGWPGEPITRAASTHLAVLGALLLVVVSFGYWLDRFDLLLSKQGAVFGAGYADVHMRLPMLKVMMVASVIAAVLLLVGGIRRHRILAGGSVVVLILLHGSAIWTYPAFMQRFTVEPNELEYELPYLKNNIEATRYAYNLADVEVKPYAGAGNLTLQDIRNVPGTIENVRIWDWRVLLAVYNQIQALRPYYHFNDADVDRYTIEGHYRQVTLSARELETALLNESSRTWVNLHLLYSHGYGLVMSPVNVVTPEGLPELWVRDIPPQSKIGMDLKQPGIYFGELTRNEIYVHTSQKEFDYPLGSENHYAEYAGTGGIAVNSTLRRLMFAYYFSDWNVLLTDSFTPETRVLWRRQVIERLRTIAPFFEYDQDPYPVVWQGRIVWITDVYTRTNRFPYSNRTRRDYGGTNYLRNPIKAVVDAYDGTVTFYVIDAKEPLAQVAHTIFPDLCKDIAEMPEELRAHLRYPLDMFEIQAEQYLAYHMTDPRIFYNKEDLWQQPNHVYEGHTQPIQAYYFIMTLPGEKQPEYLLMLPFTPSRKDNMVGWLAGRCDGKEYGKMLCYSFPKDHLVFGPNQVEARINQNDKISPLLTLWNQHGSRVVRGNLLVIPVGDSILYVEPLYLKSENAAIPELKRVIVSYQDRIAMDETFDGALQAVFGEGPAAPAKPAAGPPEGQTSAALRAHAVELYEKAQQQIKSLDWAGYGATMEELGKVLREMAGRAEKK